MSSGTNRVKRFAPKVKSGCLTCRSRRIKCDETKPSCRRCSHGNRNCLYAEFNIVKFKPQYDDVVHVPAASKLGRSPAAHPYFQGSAGANDLIHLLPLVSGLRPITSSTTRWHDYMLSCCGRSQDYVLEIPMRSGHSKVLDGAIECVASTLRWRLSRRPAQVGPPETVCLLYGGALKQLQDALKDPQESLSTLTLCATQLLFLVEALTRESKQSAIHHARGTTRLIEHLGPNKFTTTFDKSILLAQAPISYLESYATSTHCVLEQGQWQQVMTSFGETGIGHTSLHEASASAIANCSTGPGIIADWKDLVLHHSHDDRKCTALLKSVELALRSFEQFNDKWGVDLANNPLDDNSRIKNAVMFQETIRFRVSMAYIALGGLQSTRVHKRAIDAARNILAMLDPGNNNTAHGVNVGSFRLVQSVLWAEALQILRSEPPWRRCAEVNDARRVRGERAQLLPQPLVLEYLANFGQESMAKDRQLHKAGHVNDVDRWST